MNNHNRVKTIFNDVYNNFYLKIKDLDNSVKSWEEINDRARVIMNRHDQDDLCKNLIHILLHEIEEGMKGGADAK